MKTCAFLVLLSVTANALAFSSGDRYRCYDDVASSTYEVTLVDLGDKEAYVKIQATGHSRFYPSGRVLMSLNSEGATFEMLDNTNRYVQETLVVYRDSVTRRQGSGLYMDRGDSRGLDCVKLR